MKPRVSKILVYPFKGLDPVEVKETRVVEKGSLEHDREFVLVDEEGNIVSGKRERKLHQIRSSVDFETGVVRFSYQGRSYKFTLEEIKPIEDFFSEVLRYKVFLQRFPDGGLPDDRKAHGPTLVSESTLEEVSLWMDLPLENVRRRFRANLEIEGVPPFWEDRLVGEDETVRFRIGEVTLEGYGISKRCPVPTRDPYTGEEFSGFVRRFIQKRKETLPPWAPKSRFTDTYYRLCINTVIPPQEKGKFIRVGDPLIL